jgi:type VI secretion system secreted protein VgrG
MTDGDGRFLEIRSGPLLHRALVMAFRGTEAISRPFFFHLDLASEDANLSFDEIVGRPMAFSIRLSDRVEERLFHGIVRRFSVLPQHGRLFRYRAELVPWLWLLSKTSDCRIHQGLTVPEILQETFSRLGFADYQIRLTGEYPRYDYCVQYRESAFNFASRLMEQEGIFYFFQHTKERHLLVIADSPAVHSPCQIQSRAAFCPVYKTTLWEEEDCITEFQVQSRIHSSKFSTKDFDFESPSAHLLAECANTEKQRGIPELEAFIYPGDFRRRTEGDRLTDLRLQSDAAANAVITGSSACRTFESGHTFDLTEHPRRELNAQYVLTSVQHSAQAPEIYSREGESDSYRNTFSVIPKAIPFRPPASAQKPVIQGCQTGVVTGPEGEEIHTDKYGRVKVHFHWNRHSPQNAGSSCWIRVTQAWAGRNFGSIWIPRIGQEVVVDFLDGNPDRPIITGAVYNADQIHPADLPENKMRSGFHSQSTETGSPAQYNQFRIDDTPGKEEIRIHAQKDMSSKIVNDQTTNIGRNEMNLIVGSQDISVRGTDHEQIGSLDVDVVFGNQETNIKGTSTISIGTAELEAILGSANHKTSGQEQHIAPMLYRSVSRGQQIWDSKGPMISITGGVAVIKSRGTANFAANSNVTLTAGIIRIKGNVLCDHLMAARLIVSPKYSPGVNNNA